jgi:lysophospholipase L1-like esterase
VAQSVVSTLSSAFSASRSGVANLICDGDSIQAGAGVIGSAPSPLSNGVRQLEPLLTTICNVWNTGISGTTLAQQNSSFSLVPGTLYDSTKAANVFFCNGGTNDITGGATLSALQSSATGYVTKVHALGAKAKCVLSTILPQSGFTSPETTIQLGYNSWLTGGGSGADAVSDRASNPTMGNASNVTNTSLYVGGLHPTALGYSFLVPIDAAAINPLL